MLTIDGVEKHFSSTVHLGPAHFSAQLGQTIAVMGKNGSGKSTLFQMISGNTDVSKGQIRLGDETMRPEKAHLRRQIGYLPQNLELPRWVCADEVLHYAATLYQIPNPKDRVERQVDFWDVSDFRRKPLAACSYGMAKRIGLALATIHEPPLLILDEPFSGLDLTHVQALKQTLVQRQNPNFMTILSTHVAPYAAKLCHRLLIVEKGQIEEIKEWQTGDEASRVERLEKRFFAVDGPTAE